MKSRQTKRFSYVQSIKQRIPFFFLILLKCRLDKLFDELSKEVHLYKISSEHSQTKLSHIVEKRWINQQIYYGLALHRLSTFFALNVNIYGPLFSL